MKKTYINPKAKIIVLNSERLIANSNVVRPGGDNGATESNRREEGSSFNNLWGD